MRRKAKSYHVGELGREGQKMMHMYAWLNERWTSLAKVNEPEDVSRPYREGINGRSGPKKQLKGSQWMDEG
jgi:hypothetical protein